MRALRWLAGFGALFLAACGDGDRANQDPPAPALWEISAPEGAVEGWLFGTIHALPDGVEWQTPLLSTVVDQADLLVLEIAAVQHTDAMAETFAQLARTPGQPPLGSRVAPENRAALRRLTEKGGFDEADFAAIETWAAALMLAQLNQFGEASNGADRALAARFAPDRVRELEGTARQLAIFDTLPEREQRDLLDAVVSGADRAQDQSMRLMEVWRTGRIEELARQTRKGMLTDPELREALLDARNRAWAAQLAGLLEAPARPLIAVGAAHCAGETGLPTLLEQRGYRVRRLQ